MGGPGGRHTPGMRGMQAARREDFLRWVRPETARVILEIRVRPCHTAGSTITNGDALCRATSLWS
jgi:hypothetical protein